MRSLPQLLTLTASALLTTALCSAAAEKVALPLPIGIAVAQTSNTALLGQEQVIGARFAEKYINARGGINGTPIKLVFQDTGGDEAGAINAFQNLITKDKVVGIVGPTLSQQAFSADPIADRAKVPVLGPSNTAKGIPQIGPFIARVSAPVAVVAPNAIKTALRLDPKIKKVAVLYAQNDAFSTSETGTFQDTAKAQGLSVATVQKFLTTDTDFTTQVTAVLNENVDLVIVSGLANDGGNLIKQLRQLGYKGEHHRRQRPEHLQHLPGVPAVLRQHHHRAGVQPGPAQRQQPAVRQGVQRPVQEGPAAVRRSGLYRRAGDGGRPEGDRPQEEAGRLGTC